jgi:hypothetical protein
MTQDDQEFSGILPDGQATSDAQIYIKAWRDLSAKLCKIFEAQRHSYDPDISILKDGKKIDIPLLFAVKMEKLWDENVRQKELLILAKSIIIEAMPFSYSSTEDDFAKENWRKVARNFLEKINAKT